MRTSFLPLSGPESLESRIAPAGVFVNSKTVRYTDVDGDTVTLSSSVALFIKNGDTDNLDDFLTFTDGKLSRLDLTSVGGKPSAAGAVISIVATPGSNGLGDGLVNVGYIEASGVDLKGVIVDGDLGQIDAGDANFATPGLGSLTASSLGVFGALYGPGADPATYNIFSNIAGHLGPVKILHDVNVASILVAGDVTTPAKITSVFIGGSLVGSSANDSGKIQCDGAMGAVTLGGSIFGDDGNDSGRIRSGASIASVTVGGSVLGGDGTSSGSIQAATTIGSIKINQNLEGGDGNESGFISAGGSTTTTAGISRVTILGSVLGGDGNSSGRIESSKSIGPVTIARDLVGGDGTRSGTVRADDAITSVSIGGSLLGGDGDDSGGIKADANLGTTKVGGSLIGKGLGANSTFSIDASGYIKALNISSLQISGSLIAGLNKAAAPDQTLNGDLTNQSTTVALAATGTLKAGLRVTIGGFTSKILSVDGPNQITLADPFTGTTGTGLSIVFSAPTLTQSGFVHAEETIGAVTVLGDVRGSATNNAIISAGGIPGAKLALNAKTNVAIGKVTVLGSVRNSLIAAGLDSNNSAVNPDAQIGPVTVSHDWVASNLVAGISAGADGKYGTNDDTIATAGTGYVNRTNIVSKIAAITIGGQAIGTSVAGDSFGFLASSIGGLKLSGLALKIRSSTLLPANLTLSTATGSDVLLKEINVGT
ncbi:MAG: hypothetical protein RLZZ253_1929 [Verrucomicrobiota bacterium]